MKSTILILLCFPGSIAPLFAQNLESIGDKPAVKVAGSLSSRFVFYSSNNIENRRDPFGYVLGGNINVNVFDLSLPFSFTYSNQGSSFGQPFNQFGVSPTYKWVKLHAGYRNISYSSLTLSGHQMLGAGFELNPGKLRIGFMYGRLRKAVQYQMLQDTTSLDTLLNQQLPIIQNPVYQRKGWGAKIGFGDESSFIDLILFKASDDPSSLDSDSVKNVVTPAENAVLGINMRKRFFDKLTLFFEGAVSSFTLNKNLEETDSIEQTFLESLLKPFNNINNSSHFYYAFKTGLTYSAGNFNLRTQYDRIDPDYQSMGAYYFNNDLESFNITPSFYLFRNKVTVTSGVQFQHDNLQNKKLYTTHRITPRVNVSINPSYKYGIDLGYQDMITYQRTGVAELNDTTAMKMSNPGLTLGGRLNFEDSITTQNINLMMNRFSLNDQNAFTNPYSQYVALIVNLSYSLFFIKSGLGLNAAVNLNKLDNFSGTINNYGVSLGISKSFIENKMSINATMNLNFSDFGNTRSLSAGLNYNPKEKHALSLNLNYIGSNQNSISYKEFTGFLEYRYSF